jgi:hypothetical protein
MIMDVDMKKYGKPAALGALGVAAGAVALYLVIAWGSTPSPSGGIDSTHALLAYVSAAFPFAAIIAVHVVFARQLYDHAREHNARDEGS